MNKSRILFSLKQLLLIGLIIGFVYMMMDLNSRLSSLFRLTGQLDQVSTEVTYRQATEQALKQQVTFASSDAAVSQRARDERMGLPGDKLIIPLAGKQPTPEPEIQATPQVQQVVSWQVWRALFFGQ
jgi:hypothetical protein